jgi:hypothetical protein
MIKNHLFILILLTTSITPCSAQTYNTNDVL